jgi:hypothetical protein
MIGVACISLDFTIFSAVALHFLEMTRSEVRFVGTRRR